MPLNNIARRPCKICHDQILQEDLADHEIACFEFCHMQGQTRPRHGEFEDAFYSKYGKSILSAMVDAVKEARKIERNEIADKVEKVVSTCGVEHHCVEPPGCAFCSIPEQIKENKYWQDDSFDDIPSLPAPPVPVIRAKPIPPILQAFAKDQLAVKVWPLMYANPDPDHIWEVLYKQDIRITYAQIKIMCEKLGPYVKIENGKR